MISKLITHNPYRILGVYSNSPKKDVLSNLNKMKAFLKVGKSVSFPLDLPRFLPSIERDEAIVSSAQTSIELPMGQIRHSLFWFMKATPIDEIALNHLFAGNMSQAKEFWSKKETVSSLLNLMACAVIEGDLDTLAIKADTLFQKYSGDFCLSVNETIKLTSSELTELYVDLLKKDGSYDLAKMMQVSGTSAEWRKITRGSLVKPIIDDITLAVSEAKSAKGATANYRAGETLMNSTKGLISQLRSLLGISDMQYQMIADKLATTILQCGINYFNDYDEDDAAHKAMVLQKYALEIAVGQLAKERCQENYDILKKTISNLPPKEVIAEAKAITKELEKFCKLPDKIEHSITLLVNTRQHLCSIKAKLGVSNSFYLKLSTQVVGNALHNVIEEVNLAQKYDPAEERRKKAEARHRNSLLGIPEPISYSDFLEDNDHLLSHFGYGYMTRAERDNLKKFEHIKDALQRAWKVVLLMDECAMEKDFLSSRYTPNRKTLKELCIQCKIDTLSDKEREILRKQKEEKAIRDKKTRKQSNIYWICTAFAILLVASLIAVAFDHEFWEGLLVVVLPFPPVFMLSIFIINLLAEQIWKLCGNKEKFNSFMD